MRGKSQGTDSPTPRGLSLQPWLCAMCPNTQGTASEHRTPRALQRQRLVSHFNAPREPQRLLCLLWPSVIPSPLSLSLSLFSDRNFTPKRVGNEATTFSRTPTICRTLCSKVLQTHSHKLLPPSILRGQCAVSPQSTDCASTPRVGHVLALSKPRRLSVSLCPLHVGNDNRIRILSCHSQA